MPRLSLATVGIWTMLGLTTALAQTALPGPAEPIEVAPAPPPAAPTEPLTTPEPSTAASEQPSAAAPVPPPATAPVDPPVGPTPAPVEVMPTPPTSTVSEPPATSPAVPATPPASVPGAPAARPGGPGAATKPTKPHTEAALMVMNGRAFPITQVTVMEGRRVVKRSGPLPPNARVTLKLPNLRGCIVSVRATFRGGAVSRVGKLNVCKELILVRL
jgi:cytoskeletal protein RodZ